MVPFINSAIYNDWFLGGPQSVNQDACDRLGEGRYFGGIVLSGLGADGYGRSECGAHPARLRFGPLDDHSPADQRTHWWFLQTQRRAITLLIILIRRVLQSILHGSSWLRIVYILLCHRAYQSLLYLSLKHRSSFTVPWFLILIRFTLLVVWICAVMFFNLVRVNAVLSCSTCIGRQRWTVNYPAEILYLATFLTIFFIRRCWFIAKKCIHVRFWLRAPVAVSVWNSLNN